MEFKLRIPDELLLKMLNDPDAAVTCELVLVECKTKSRVKSKFEPPTFICAPDKQIIIDAWNNHHVVKESCIGGLSRNLPASVDQLSEIIPVLDKLLKRLDTQHIIAEINKYLDACSRQEHVWDNVNHAFKRLSSFLEKLLSSDKTGTIPWWRTKKKMSEEIAIVDKNPEITKLLCDEYVRHFARGSDAESFAKNVKMIKAAAIINNVLQCASIPANNLQDLVFRAIRNILMKQIVDKGDPVQPGHLCSENLWHVLMPQYLTEQVGLPESAVAAFCKAAHE